MSFSVKKLICLFLVLGNLIIAGCTNSTTSNPTVSDTPQLPGGIIGGSITVDPVLNFTATASPTVPGQLTLTWDVPSIYTPLIQAYYVEVFQNQCSASDVTCVQPDPTTQSNINQVIYAGTESSTTISNLSPGANYTFWAFVSFESNWSTASAVSVSMPQQSTTISNILSSNNITTFWNNYIYSVGQAHINPDQSTGTQSQSADLFNSTFLTEYPQNPVLNPGIGYLTNLTNSNSHSIAFLGTFSSGSNTINLNSTSVGGFYVGQPISDVTNSGAIPSGTYITGVSGQSLLISSNTTGASNSSGDTLSTVISAGGNIALGSNGAVLYYSDTVNNRVLVGIRQSAYTCLSQQSVNQQLCLLANANAQDNFVIVNTLGQSDPNGATLNSCQDKANLCSLHNNPSSGQASSNQGSEACSTDTLNLCEWDGLSNSCIVDGSKCLTHPTGITVDGSNVIISDTGNNRVMVYTTAPAQNACANLFQGASGISTNTNCSATIVVGKKGPNDICANGVCDDYSDLTQYGQNSLSSPGAVATYNGDLYIADVGNHRIVRAGSYSDSSKFNCTIPIEQNLVSGYDYSNTYFNNICSFNFLLGQQYYLTKTTFADLVYSSVAAAATSTVLTPVISSIGSGNTIDSHYTNVLARYFANPTSLKFDSSGNLFVASDESFILSNSNISAIANSTANSTQTQTNFNSWYNSRNTASNPSVGLKSRILEFSSSEVTGSNPGCQSYTFLNGGCDASAVLGQPDLNTLFVLTSGDSTGTQYSGLSGAVSYITDFIVNGNTVAALDNATNSLFVWSNWNQPAVTPNFFSIPNPQGINISQTLNAPILNSVSGLAFDSVSNTILISDTGNGQIYVIKPQSGLP